jgi:hypothetical protein
MGIEALKKMKGYRAAIFSSWADIRKVVPSLRRLPPAGRHYFPITG